MAERPQSSMVLYLVVPMELQHEMTLMAFLLRSSELMEFPLQSSEHTNMQNMRKIQLAFHYTKAQTFPQMPFAL